jgi:phage terminase large subunit-like protein
MAKKSARSLVNTSLGIRLSSHEKLCAERMKQLLKSVDELNKKVSKLSDEVSTGKGMVKVLVFLGTIAAACIGFFNWR